MSSIITKQPEKPVDSPVLPIQSSEDTVTLQVTTTARSSETERRIQPQKTQLVAPLPTIETARLNALHRYSIPDENEEIFNTLTRMAAQITACPVATLSYIYADCVIHKSRVGIVSDLFERQGSFWSWAILQPNLFVVADASLDERFEDNSLVAQAHGIRFFAAAPLITADGFVIGTLAVMDWRMRELTPTQAEGLTALASSIMAHLELQRKKEDSEGFFNNQVMLGTVGEYDAHLVENEQKNAGTGFFTALVEQKVAELKKKYEVLAHREEQFSLVINSTNDGMWDWDLRTNTVIFSDKWKALLGYTEEEISSRPDEWFCRIHPEDKETVEADVMSHLLGLTPYFRSEHRIRNSFDEYRWVLSRGMAARNQNKEVYRFAGSITDVTEQKDMEQQLFHDAFHDALTGLPNRTLFMDKLKRLLEHPRQSEEFLFAVLFLDVDKFKFINDSLGHHIGDKLLIEIARRLENSTRPGDMIARLGGDEFAVLLERIKDVDDATLAAQRIQQELSIPFDLNGSAVFASASIGISHNLVPCRSAEDFIRNADTAMYRAKEQRRGSFELFDIGMHEQAVVRMQLENDLRHALVNDEFEVHYQPIVSLVDYWKIKGFEALIRWHHPEKGLISPVRFIPVAEETGLIMQIGEWVLREACKQIRRWQEMFPMNPPLFMSVNLSCKQFNDVNLVNNIKTTLTETEIDASSLKIEITESAIIENIEAATVVLNQLKELGVKISLDDFGTGYSSLSYLHRFPIDTLKIDRSFIMRMQEQEDEADRDETDKNSEIVSTILSLAATLGMDVIAEGVETREQVDALNILRCSYVQGYRLSKPMNSEAMTRLISETYVSGMENSNR